MAKAKTTTKRNNKNISASSGKGLKRRFDLRSRKVQFFVVILIVALLGGGYYTYKSFAATVRQSWSYSISQGNVQQSSYGNCNARHYNEPSKNNTLVWSLICQHKDSVNSEAKVTTTGGYLPVGFSGNYRICTYFKGVSPNMTITLKSNSGSGVNKPRYITPINTGSSYVYYCGYSEYLYAPASISGVVSFKDDLGPARRGQDIWVNVSSIGIERLN